MLALLINLLTGRAFSGAGRMDRALRGVSSAIVGLRKAGQKLKQEEELLRSELVDLRHRHDDTIVAMNKADRVAQRLEALIV